MELFWAGKNCLKYYWPRQHMSLRQWSCLLDRLHFQCYKAIFTEIIERIPIITKPITFDLVVFLSELIHLVYNYKSQGGDTCFKGGREFRRNEAKFAIWVFGLFIQLFVLQ